ncbi:MAG: efflux RND transporter periplasmic adaptor subunit [Acidobacteria bacterium]|nr:efflux RND transporter periplasmic adaptor subunit [Acidobacteriota bacterium]
MKRVIIRTIRALLPLIIVAAAAFAAVTMIMNRPPVETLTPVIEPPGVRVHEVSLQDASLSVTSQGTVQPRTESQLVPEIAGRVTWVAPSFAEGGFFEAGDVLVEIDPFDYEQALVGARSQLAQARLRLAQEEAEAEVAQREWDTLGRGDPRELALRKPQLEDARASVAAAEAGVERATRDLQRAEIVAPYAGRVRTKNVDIGQYVRVGDALATVYAVDVAEIRLPLPDDELAYLDLPLSYRGVEQQVRPLVTLHATFAGETHAWDGLIVRTESEIDSVSRMVHAIAEVPDPYAPGPNPNRPPLAVGMYVEAEINGRTARDVAVLPRQALRGRDQVLVVTPDDRLSFRTIAVLRTSTESVIVRSGLQAGELVVISPLDTPTDGMRVQLADADPGLLERRAAAAAAPPSQAAAPAAQRVDAPASQVGAPAATAASNVPIEPAAARRAEAAPGVPPVPAEPAAAARPGAARAVAATEQAPPGAPGGGATTAGRADQPQWLASLLAERRPAAENLRSRPPRTRPAAARPTRGRPDAESVARPARRRPGAEPVARPAATVAAAPRRPALRTPDAAPASVVAVASFASLNRATGDAGLGPALSRAVAARLASSDDIAVSENESDARYVVRGGLQQVGPLVRVTARIVDTENGAVLHAAKIDGSTADRPALEADVAAAVIEHLTAMPGSTAPTASGGMAAGATTPSALAVLPFDDLSAGSASALDVDLGSVIAEAIAERLSTLAAVAVVTPGDEAAWAVGGGIQRIGTMVRVTARLTDVRSGAVVTAVKVDGTVEALADLQSRVAAVMTESVREALAGESVARSGPATDPATRRREGRRS